MGEYLVPEESSLYGFEQQDFISLLEITSMGIDAVRAPTYAALIAYRREVNGNAVPRPLNGDDIQITVDAQNQYTINIGGSVDTFNHPMDVWNKINFHGSFRKIGQWCSEEILIQGATRKVMKLDVSFRSAEGVVPIANNLHKVGIGKENSYVATPYYAEGKPYSSLIGSIKHNPHGVNGNIHHLNPTRATSFAAFDEMISESDNGDNICQEASVYKVSYANGLPPAYTGRVYGDFIKSNVNTLANQIEAHIKQKITIDAFISCYKLVIGNAINVGIAAVDQGDVNTSCNLRVFELFSAVAISEVHRESYVALVNAAMMDLFKTPQEHRPVLIPAAATSFYSGAGDTFYDFFGDDDTHFNKHSLGFSGANSATNIEGKEDGAIHWYVSKDNINIVRSRENEVTKHWLNLLHNYECWILNGLFLDGLGQDYETFSRVDKLISQMAVNLQGKCDPDVMRRSEAGDWAHLRISFKIYAGYQVAKHLNGWPHSDNTHDADIANRLGDTGAKGMNLATNALNYPSQGDAQGAKHPLYNEIADCISQAVALPASACGGFMPDSDDQEVCLDVHCGLLKTNYLDYT